MFDWLKVFSITLIASGLASYDVKADEQLMGGIRPFVCDGKPVVFVEVEGSWTLSQSPDTKVSKIRDGWQIGDQGMGFIAYLKGSEKDEWTFEVLADDGYEKIGCTDLADSVSEVVTVIKPRLDTNMMAQLTNTELELTNTQAQLVKSEEELRIAKDDLSRMRTMVAEAKLLPSNGSYNLAIQRVERLCIWMKTYQHLDVLEKSFSFEGKPYKLCN